MKTQEALLVTRDHYRCLGVEPTASRKEIKRAFRRQVKLNHPDVHPDDPGAGARMREIILAYQVLSDPFQRVRYNRIRDLFGSQPRSAQSTPSPNPRMWANRPRRPAGTVRRQRSFAYVLILSLLIGLSLVTRLKERDWNWVPGPARMWKVDPAVVEHARSQTLADRACFDAARLASAAQWDIWFWEREFVLNPTRFTGERLMRAYENIAEPWARHGRSHARRLGSAASVES